MIENDNLELVIQNNLRYNVRDGGGRVNNSNKSMYTNNTSSITGVRFEGGPKARWRACWVDKERGKVNLLVLVYMEKSMLNKEQLIVECSKN